MQIAWRNVSNECFQEFNAWFFASYIMAMCFTAPAGCVLGCFLLYVPCCGAEMCSIFPVIWRIHQGDHSAFEGSGDNNNPAMTQAVLGGLNKTRNEGLAKECAICMIDFTDDDEIVPLPCNKAHVFHEECIAQWLKQKTTCPLCRAPVTE